ncbi:VOC family protein [Arthrobacter sp. TMS1-12-1]
MSDPTGPVPPVRQLRLVVEAEDYDAAVVFYRDVLGLPEEAAFEGGDGALVTILDAGGDALALARRPGGAPADPLRRARADPRGRLPDRLRARDHRRRHRGVDRPCRPRSPRSPG